ncbi:MAG: hypothetical protein JST54_08105 [Deltaproteobacteria bacterium]|nr:hypothetical protein [Deltaproteobacteria bacterium]
MQMSRSSERLWFALPLVAYLGLLAVFPAPAFVVSDENSYVSEAVALASGHFRIVKAEPFSAATAEKPASTYPIGTSLMQVPFVWLFGWRAAIWSSALCLIGTVLLTARMLARLGLAPEFSLLLMLNPVALVMGRIGMSDVPSMFVVTCGLSLLVADHLGVGRAFLGGLCGGLSTLWRETNILVIAPFVAGATLRRERTAVPMIVGMALGLAIRGAVAAWLFGSPLFVRDSGYGFSPASIAHHLPLYLFAMTVFIPGGLLAVAKYRGPRRVEVLGAVLGFFLFYCAYNYAADESGGVKQLILGPRYLLPITPLLALVIAAVVQASPRPRLVNSLPLLFRSLAVALVAAAAVAQVGVRNFGRTQAVLVAAIYAHTPDDASVLTNATATGKLFSQVYGRRNVFELGEAKPEEVARIRDLHAPLYLATLERPGTAYFDANRVKVRNELDDLSRRCRLVPIDTIENDRAERLSIVKVETCLP